MARIGPVSIQTGSSPRTERWWIRARGVRPWSRDRAARRRSASPTEASQICEATAAVIRPPGASGSRPAIFSSEVSRGHSSVAKRRRREVDGSISLSNRPSAIAVRARSCEASANSSISSRLMSHFSAIISARAELADLLVAVPLQPAGRLGERRGEAVLLADQHRRRDRDRGHVLHAAGDDEVLGAGHHALRGEVHRLLGGAALPVDGHARARGRAARPPARRCGRRRRPASRWCRSSPGSRRRRRPGRRRCAAPAPPSACAPRSAECTLGERAAALADRRADGVDDVGLRHVAIPSRRMVRYWSATSSWREVAAGAVPADRDPDGVADEPVGELDVEVGAQRAGLDALGRAASIHTSRDWALRSAR